MRKAIQAMAVLGLLVAASSARAQTHTYVLASDATSSIGGPTANLASANGDTILYQTLAVYGTTNIFFYPINAVVDGLVATKTLTSGPGNCTTKTQYGGSYWTLVVPETATSTIDGRAVTVSATYTLTSFYRGGSGRGGGGAGCHYVLLAGGSSTITFD